MIQFLNPPWILVVRPSQDWKELIAMTYMPPNALGECAIVNARWATICVNLDQANQPVFSLGLASLLTKKMMLPF